MAHVRYVDCKGCGEAIGLEVYEDPDPKISRWRTAEQITCARCDKTFGYAGSDFQVGNAPSTE